MNSNYHQQVSRLNSQRNQLLQQRQQHGIKTSQSKIQYIRNRSNHSKSKSPGKFLCDPAHLKELKRILDGIISNGQGETFEIRAGLEFLKQTQKEIAHDLKEKGFDSFSISRGKNTQQKTNSQKLLKLKRIIDMIISNNQKDGRVLNSGLKNLKDTERKVLQNIKDVQKREQEDVRHFSAYGSNDNQFTDIKDDPLKSKIEVGIKRSVQKMSRTTQSQIERLREQNIRLQAWLNEEIKKNIELRKQISRLKKTPEDDSQSIIHRLKKNDQKSLEHENNILKSKIKNLQMEILNIQHESKGNGNYGHNADNMINQYETEISQKSKMIKRLENDIHNLKEQHVKQITSKNYITQELKEEIRYLRQRIRSTKNDNTGQNLKRQTRRPKIQNQKMRLETPKAPQVGQSYQKMQKLLQQNDNFRHRLRQQDLTVKTNNTEQDRPTTHTAYHSPSVQNLFSASRHYKVNKGHTRNESDKFSMDFGRPRAQIDLHRE